MGRILSYCLNDRTRYGWHINAACVQSSHLQFILHVKAGRPRLPDVFVCRYHKGCYPRTRSSASEVLYAQLGSWAASSSCSTCARGHLSGLHAFR